MKRILILVLALVMVLSFVACGQAQPSEKTSTNPAATNPASNPASTNPAPANSTSAAATDPLSGTLDFCIGNPGGTGEIIGGALIELLKDAMPNMEISSIQSAGTAASTMMLAQRGCDLAMVTAESVYTATTGGEPFNTPTDSLRAICALYPNTLQIWANKDANIKELADIADKRICFGVPSSSQYYPFFKILNSYGLSPEIIGKNGGSVTTVAWGDAVDMFSDGNLDALIWETSYPAAAIVNAQAGGKEFDFVQMDPAKMQEFMSTYPGWVKVNVPAGTYAGQTEDVTCMGTYMAYYVDKDVPDEVAYKITETICNNFDILGNTHALMKNVSEATIGMNLGGEIHPGAQKYYEEHNIQFGA
jgi:TRAP transporter TAXI family solute receptor